MIYIYIYIDLNLNLNHHTYIIAAVTAARFYPSGFDLKIEFL